MSEQWLGLHNPERHEPYAGQFAGYAECLPVLGGCLAECGEDDPCRCCLAAEVETLRAQVQAVRDVCEQQVKDRSLARFLSRQRHPSGGGA